MNIRAKERRAAPWSFHRTIWSLALMIRPLDRAWASSPPMWLIFSGSTVPYYLAETGFARAPRARASLGVRATRNASEDAAQKRSRARPLIRLPRRPRNPNIGRPPSVIRSDTSDSAALIVRLFRKGMFSWIGPGRLPRLPCVVDRPGDVGIPECPARRPTDSAVTELQGRLYNLSPNCSPGFSSFSVSLETQPSLSAQGKAAEFGRSLFVGHQAGKLAPPRLFAMARRLCFNHVFITGPKNAGEQHLFSREHVHKRKNALFRGSTSENFVFLSVSSMSKVCGERK